MIIAVVDYNELFVETYVENRAKFRTLLKLVQNHWPEAVLESHAIGAVEDCLTIDMIKAPPHKSGKRLIILSSGLHGIEGYIGAAILQLFVREYLPSLNPQDTALYLIHAINPWGMQNRRRVNENNVDLNRNFNLDREFSGESINSYYQQANVFINPATSLKSTNSPILPSIALYDRNYGPG